MRKFNKGQHIGAIKQAARGAADRAYRDQVRSLQPKFQPGADPLDREAGIKILEPTDAQQLQKMTQMLEKLYAGGTPQEQQALELWKMQIAQGTVRDQVKLDFMRRFYFWLLGRGDQADHDKTLWGRANTAVYNKEVASYIDMFVDKRTKYVMKLRALANNVPDTLNGMYLYYKVIIVLLFFCMEDCGHKRRAFRRNNGKRQFRDSSYVCGLCTQIPKSSVHIEYTAGCHTNVTPIHWVLGNLRCT